MTYYDFLVYGICSIHDGERPYDPCIKFTAKECGRSQFAELWQTQQTIEEIQSIQFCAKPTLEEAIEDFMLRMHRCYSI